MRGEPLSEPPDSGSLTHCIYTSYLNLYGLFSSPALLPWATIPLSLTFFICTGSILAKPKGLYPYLSNTAHSHRMCTNVSFSAPYILHEGVFVLLILCSIYRYLICPVRNPTSNLQCFLSNLLMNWTYISVCLLDIVGCAHTVHRLSIPFLFPIQFFIWGLNLLKVSDRKDFRPM